MSANRLAVVAVVALAAFVAACAPSTPTPATTAVPPPALAPASSTAPTAPSPLAPMPVPAANLVVAGTVREWCGSIGGCAYFVAIDGPGGSWNAEFDQVGAAGELVVTGGLPGTIPAGTYVVTLSSAMVSDVILNGVRELGSTDATCTATLDASDGASIQIQALFDRGSCEADVTA